MKTDKGWIKLHRQIADDEMWSSEPFDKSHAWIDLLLSANHKMGFFFVRGNKIDIDRGQLGWSELTMAKRWTWSRNKVRRFLNLLEKEQQIAQKKSSITTVLTIINYDKYQTDDTTDDTTERQQKDSRRYTNKNDKNDKNTVLDAKNSLTVLTKQDRRKLALELYVDVPTIFDTEKAVLNPENISKYKYKTTYHTVSKWVQRSIANGSIKRLDPTAYEVMSGLYKEDHEHQR